MTEGDSGFGVVSFSYKFQPRIPRSRSSRSIDRPINEWVALLLKVLSDETVEVMRYTGVQQLGSNSHLLRRTSVRSGKTRVGRGIQLPVASYHGVERFALAQQLLLKWSGPRRWLLDRSSRKIVNECLVDGSHCFFRFVDRRSKQQYYMYVPAISGGLSGDCTFPRSLDL